MTINSETVAPGAQLDFADVSEDRNFGLRERDEILALIGRAYRLTAADRARLVQIAAVEAGARPSVSTVNAFLRAKVSKMLRPLTPDDVQRGAVAMSPCGLFAILPITERVFYQFINRAFSPEMRGVFLWESFIERFANFRYVYVHRETSIIDRPWWSAACRNLIFRSGEYIRAGGHWQSLGFIDEEVAPLVELFPKWQRQQPTVLPDRLTAAIRQRDERFLCAR